MWISLFFLLGFDEAAGGLGVETKQIEDTPSSDFEPFQGHNHRADAQTHIGI